MFVPLFIGIHSEAALLDSGAADSFISERTVQKLRLPTLELKHPMWIQVANGQVLQELYFVRITAKLGQTPVRLFLRVINTPLEVVLGFQFLYHFNPRINWRSRTLYTESAVATYKIKTMPINLPDLDGITHLHPHNVSMQWATF